MKNGNFWVSEIITTGRKIQGHVFSRKAKIKARMWFGNSEHALKSRL